jgi:hypothetical protein
MSVLSGEFLAVVVAPIILIVLLLIGPEWDIRKLNIFKYSPFRKK